MKHQHLPSPRIMEVWRGIANGHDNDRIAYDMGITRKSVGIYVGYIYEFLGLTDCPWRLEKRQIAARKYHEYTRLLDQFERELENRIFHYSVTEINQ